MRAKIKLLKKWLVDLVGGKIAKIIGVIVILTILIMQMSCQIADVQEGTHKATIPLTAATIGYFAGGPVTGLVLLGVVGAEELFLPTGREEAVKTAVEGNDDAWIKRVFGDDIEKDPVFAKRIKKGLGIDTVEDGMSAVGRIVSFLKAVMVGLTFIAVIVTAYVIKRRCKGEKSYKELDILKKTVSDLVCSAQHGHEK